IVPGDEVGFGIDLDDDAEVLIDGQTDKTLRRHAPTLFGRLGEAFLAQPVDRLLDVAVGLAQRIFAIHHARAGLLAQILDQPRGNGRHRVLFILERHAAQLGAETRLQVLFEAEPAAAHPQDKKAYSAAISARACSLHLSRATRPLNLRSASSLAV